MYSVRCTPTFQRKRRTKGKGWAALGPRVGPGLRRFRLRLVEEEGDGETVECLFAGLRDDLVDNFDAGMRRQPVGNLLPQIIPLLRHGGREDLHSGESVVI